MSGAEAKKLVCLFEMSLSESGRVVTKTQNKQLHLIGIRQAKKSAQESVSLTVRKLLIRHAALPVHGVIIQKAQPHRISSMCSEIMITSSNKYLSTQKLPPLTIYNHFSK